MNNQKLEDLRAQEILLRKQIHKLEDKKARTIKEALVGKCFKFRNCYSCPQSPSDYWWLYTKVLKLKSTSLIVERFQIDKDGQFILVLNEPTYHYFNDRYIEITLKEYTIAKNKFKELIKKW